MARVLTRLCSVWSGERNALPASRDERRVYWLPNLGSIDEEQGGAICGIGVCGGDYYFIIAIGSKKLPRRFEKFEKLPDDTSLLLLGQHSNHDPAPSAISGPAVPVAFAVNPDGDGSKARNNWLNALNMVACPQCSIGVFAFMNGYWRK